MNPQSASAAGASAGQQLREAMGPAFADYYCRIMEAEIERFRLATKDAGADREVSEWEHREYFDLL